MKTLVWGRLHKLDFDGFRGLQPKPPTVGDGINFVAVRPRNIAFNYIVRAA